MKLREQKPIIRQGWELASLWLAKILLTVALAGTLPGCATNGTPDESDFFTSGSREADQRATQTMAREEQVAGNGKEKPKPTLYERLGGERGLTAIVDDFAGRALVDPRVNWIREGIERGGFLFRRGQPVSKWQPTPENLERLKKHLVQFLALATGGPAEYGGEDMKAVHEGMRITDAEFNAVVGDLVATLDKLRVPDQEQKELLAIVETTRPMIVSER